MIPDSSQRVQFGRRQSGTPRSASLQAIEEFKPLHRLHHSTPQVFRSPTVRHQAERELSRSSTEIVKILDTIPNVADVPSLDALDSASNVPSVVTSNSSSSPRGGKFTFDMLKAALNNLDIRLVLVRPKEMNNLINRWTDSIGAY